MTQKEAFSILEKYSKNQCTPLEKVMVEDWLMHFNEEGFIQNEETINKMAEAVANRLPISLQLKKDVKVKLWPRLTIAALIAGIGIFIFYAPRVYKTNIKESTADIAPGINTATIKLANGKSIMLSNRGKGIAIKAGELSYVDGALIAENLADKSTLNEITTPRGGQYQMVLDDGTKVWINAESALKFPSDFKGSNDRQVELLYGEVYFEVAKDKAHPFKVVSKSQTVQVLGTHFNINNYSDENSVKTTLLEGSVKVNLAANTPANAVILKPGEQSITAAGKPIQVKKIDARLEIAWKNGRIAFDEANLKDVMDMLQRWYNIKVSYTNYPENARFTGSVSRNRNISEILSVLESTGEVHFKIKGREVEVLN